MGVAVAARSGLGSGGGGMIDGGECGGVNKFAEQPVEGVALGHEGGEDGLDGESGRGDERGGRVGQPVDARKEKEEEGDLGERAMRSVIAAAVSILCAKDEEENEEEKAELTRSRDDNPETTFGQRLGDIANILLPKVIELLTQDQHERFSRHRIIRTPETKVCVIGF